MKSIEELFMKGLLPPADADFSSLSLQGAVVVPAEDSVGLARHGIRIEGSGTDNTVILESASVQSTSIILNLAEASSCTLVVGKSEQLTASVSIRGHRSLCCFAGVSSAQGPNNVRANIDGNDSVMYFGQKTTFVGAQFLLEGDGRKLLCGDDCMFSWGIFCRNYDSHSIFDLENGEILNRPTDLVIGSHVWIGQDVLVAKGVTIGRGCVIGARSTVTADLPPSTAAAGTPARPVRSNIGWTRMRYATEEAISEVRRPRLV